MPPARTGWRLGGKQAVPPLETSSLDGALAPFCGSSAADALSEGPLCGRSIVAHRTCKRLVYHVRDQDPTQADLTAFFRRFQAALEPRGVRVQALPTDASPLSPEPLAQVFGAVPPPLCACHVLKALTQAVRRAVAQVHKRLAAPPPSLPRGRPRPRPAKRAARQRQRRHQQGRALLDHRYLCVQPQLTAAERQTLPRSTQGLPPLRSLRAIRDEVSRLVDRRCRTDTAWATLARLRHRGRRFRQVRRTWLKLVAANLANALTGLDDALLPSTSKAVERRNRRHRQMQKTVYRVRTQEHLTARIALDMLRDVRKQDRQETRTTLHSTRAR
jgi:hypothetical protein